MYGLIDNINSNREYFLQLVTISRIILHYLCQPSGESDSDYYVYSNRN